MIIDDTPENIDVLKSVLIADYIVRPALNGPVALKAARIEPYPDLILLDIMMPGMDGYEVCRHLKADELTRDIPIIFVTAKSEVDDELQGLKLGAVDYITKPFNIAIVQARVKTHLALRSAQRKLDAQNQVLLHERQMIESLILKMRRSDTFDARYLRHLVAPVEVTAGDMLLSTFTPEGRQLILLGDFTGHGLPAAIGGPLVTYIFEVMAKSGATGLQIIDQMNNQLCTRLPTGIFFAATLLEIATDRRQTTLWNAGLPDMVWMRHGEIKDRFPSGMPPLGIIKNLNFSREICHFMVEQGDTLYAFTDGILEAKGEHEEMFGLARLEAFLKNLAVGKRVLEDLIGILDRYVGSSTHGDDITLVEISI
ncbi:MAG: SpoIIE family protein phosphatase [Magnetococcus sp. DMHC-6]